MGFRYSRHFMKRRRWGNQPWDPGQCYCLLIRNNNIWLRVGVLNGF